MKVSILINNFNYARFVARAIDSALDQTVAAEVVVVDDGSTDESRDIIAGYGDRIRTVFKENGGQASCFNAGFAASSGDILCLLDADDHYLPDKVARLAAIYAAHPEIGWCYHSLTRADAAGRNVGDEILGTQGLVDVRRTIRRGFMGMPTPATSAITFRRSVLDQLLPMPSAPGIAVGDHYLKLGAAALAPGYMLRDQLAVQTVHEANRYTGKDNFGLKAQILIRTAAALRDSVPAAAAFTDNLAGTGQALAPADAESQRLLAGYLAGGSLLTRLRVALWRAIKGRRGRSIGHAPIQATAAQ